MAAGMPCYRVLFLQPRVAGSTPSKSSLSSVFLQSTAATSAAAPAFGVLPVRSPAETLQVACIGVGGMGSGDLCHRWPWLAEHRPPENTLCTSYP